MTRLLWLTVVTLGIPSGIEALSMSAGDAQLARGRLNEALSSPSGKLTISAEIAIPEPSDPTALLLQSTAVIALSEKIRSKAKANSAWLSGTINSVKTFCGEQETARGSFPGPVPVVFCTSKECTSDELEEVAHAGASGIIVTVLVDNIATDEAFAAATKSALEHGLQPIPEVVMGDADAASCTEDDVTALVEKLTSAMGSEPVSVLLTINPEDEDVEEVSLPRVPKALGKKVPVLGSVRVSAGEGRIGQETARLKEAGFTGALLRSDCVPGFRMNPDLEVVGRFWSACVGDLKSTRSKSFSFRAANNMEKNVPLEWAKYQNDVVDSGALGDMNDNYADVDESTGEYLGF